MSEMIVLEGKEYVSARRAADETGYARDYIGQLARKGLIGAQRVGGLWYVSLESLKGYQANAESYTPTPPIQQGMELDTIVSFDGKDYVSASRAAKISGYNQDYVGQLARAGKVLSRQIGNRWYVEKSGLLAHKSEKDALLAAVQRESVGLTAYGSPRPATSSQEPYTPYFSYVAENSSDLIPDVRKSAYAPAEKQISRVSAIAIPAVRPSAHVVDMRTTFPGKGKTRSVRTTGKTMRRALKIGSALTFVIVISYGLSTLKSDSRYTFNSRAVGSTISQTATALLSSEALDRFSSYLESILAPQLHYIRK